MKEKKNSERKSHAHRTAKVLIGFNFGKHDTRKNKGETVSCDEITKEVFEDLLAQKVIEEIK